MQTEKTFISCGLIAGCALIVACFAWMHFAAVEALSSAEQPPGPQCSGYEELGDAPANVSGFQELAPPDCG